MKKILICVVLLVFVRATWADVVVAPSDLAAILSKVSQQQKRLYPEPKEAAKVTVKDGWIAFTDQSGETEVDTFFSDASETIAKHIRLKQGENEYAFSVTLQKIGKAYHHDIQKVNGADALVFFNDEDDLKQKIKYYLSHDEERLRIAENGYREVLEYHSYAHRVGKMIAIIEGSNG